MITHRRPRTNTRSCAWAAAAVLVLALGACGDEDLVDPQERLCRGETGVGLLIEGRAQPLEFCVDDADVSVVLTNLNRYDVEARVTAPAGVFVMRMVFAVRSFPAVLDITDDLSRAVADPNSVWLFYEEIPDGGDPIESFAVLGGTFTLSFVDEDVATGLLDGVVFDMRDVSTGEAAGEREFVEGMFSISTKEPAVSAHVH